MFLKTSGVAAVGAATGAIAAGAGAGMLVSGYLTKRQNLQRYDDLNPNPYQGRDLDSDCNKAVLFGVLTNELSLDSRTIGDPWKTYNTLKPEDQLRVQAAYSIQMAKEGKIWMKRDEPAREKASLESAGWARGEGALIGGGVGAVFGIPTARVLEVISDMLVIDPLKEHRLRKYGGVIY